MRPIAVVMLVAGCGRIGFDATARCDEPWSAPSEVALGLTGVGGPSISNDDLDLYVYDSASPTLWLSHRSTRSEAFRLPTVVVIPALPNGDGTAADPSISSDGLDLYFRTGSGGQALIVVSHRASRSSAFEIPSHPGTYGTGDVTSDGLAFYSADYQSPIVVQRRASTSEAFGPMIDLGPPVNDGSSSSVPSISSDELELYFASDRAGPLHVWVATRPDRSSPFDTVEMVDIPEADYSPEISADGHHLYFIHEDSTGTHVLVSSRCE